MFLYYVDEPRAKGKKYFLMAWCQDW